MPSTIGDARAALRAARWKVRNAPVREGGRAMWVVLARRRAHTIFSIAESRADAWCEAARLAEGLTHA